MEKRGQRLIADFGLIGLAKVEKQNSSSLQWKLAVVCFYRLFLRFVKILEFMQPQFGLLKKSDFLLICRPQWLPLTTTLTILSFKKTKKKVKKFFF